MPVVPFAPQPPKGRALPKPIEFSAAEEPWVLMAAAQMHSEGRLIEKPSTAKDIYETRPQASLGGRSLVEANNPELGPDAPELQRRQQEFEAQRQKDQR